MSERKRENFAVTCGCMNVLERTLPGRREPEGVFVFLFFGNSGEFMCCYTVPLINAKVANILAYTIVF